MAHPATPEASSAPANSGDAVEDFADFLDGQTADDEDQEGADDAAPEETDEVEDDPSTDEEADDDADEPDSPAIEPPVSWDKDAKELFAQLPPELQTKIAEREAQREKQVQAKSIEAAEAKRTARAEATAEFVETQRQYASELEQYAKLLEPQRPDPSIFTTHGPEVFYQQMAMFEAAQAQHQQMVQQAQAARADAVSKEQAAHNEAMQREMEYLAEHLPGWNDPTNRQATLTELVKLGADLGYPPDRIQQANAGDLLALHKASEWKAKAEKYDKLQSSKMAAVRAAKELPKVSKPGGQSSRAEQSARRSDTAWAKVKATKSPDAMADFLESSGFM